MGKRGTSILLVLILSVLAACSGQDDQASITRPPEVVEGERIFRSNCTSCHSTKPGVTIVGPSLDGIATRANTRMEGLDAREYIHLSIIKPSAYVVDGFVDQMPSGFGSSFSPEELDHLISFLLTLE